MSFRWNTRTLYLTYSQCSLPKEEVYSQLAHILEWKCANGIEKYLVAEEKHQDGGDHLHVFLMLSKRLQSRNSRLLDLEGIEGEAYHPNVETKVRSPARVIRYCKKDGNFITNLSFEIKSDPWKEMMEAASAGGIAEARSLIAQARTRDSIIYATQIDRALIAVLRATPPDLENLSMDHFSCPIPEWDVRKTLIIQGASGLGKTCLAKLLLPGALFCSHVDALKSFSPGVHSGIIFDDLEFKHLPRTTQIHLTDYQDDRDIHCRHSNAFVPRFTSKIMTTNLKHWDILNTNEEAIHRRTTCWKVKKTKRKGILVKLVY